MRLLFTSISLIFPVALATSSANTLFKIPSGSTPGNCDAYSLDQVVKDASDMAQAAITAINNYQKQSWIYAAAPGVMNTRNSAYAMFGAEGQASKILNRVLITSSGSAILDNVKTNYQKAIDLLNSNTQLSNGDKPSILACDDTFLKWVTEMQDINPKLEGTDEGKLLILDEYKNIGKTFDSDVRGFYFSNWENAFIMIQDQGLNKPDGSAGGALCTDGTMYAETWSIYGFMLMCPRAFQLPANIASAVGGSSGTPKGTDIDTYKTTAGAFLHEIMHFLGTNTATGGKITDQLVGTDEKAYQWENCAILGTNAPDLALLNADSYHYFAVASTLGSVNFGTEGVAQ